MPKIEVYADSLYSYIGRKYSNDELEALLPAAKAELDGEDREAGILKIELNDTNRPDLWSTAGLGRQLRVYEGSGIPEYGFFSVEGAPREFGGRVVNVSAGLAGIRPYIAAFAVTGRKFDEPMLKDIIQTQEKLCWNYGRKRKSIAMGVYRSDDISFPVSYHEADPDTVKFRPLQMDDREYSLREIIEKHPKGQEFGHIVADFQKYPFLTGADGGVLSFPPVINSAGIGAVKVGDENLFIELTGTDLPSLTLAASIVACDLADAGCTILPVKVVYPEDTEFGREIVFPYYFQKKASVETAYAQKLLGVQLAEDKITAALARMGCSAKAEDGRIVVDVPEYRNDFLHPVDVIEDIMIGKSMDFFSPEMPSDFTVGRISAEEEFARKARNIMVGMGFQEMMYNYLGSGRDYIEKMKIDGSCHVRIANPMTENYEYVRASILPALLNSEAVSANAVYPHAIFEAGKVAFLDDSDNSGTATRNYLSFLSADRSADFNQASSSISALMYYLGLEYTLAELEDPRFIGGRGAEVRVGGKTAGFFGEVHPEVLEAWGISVPCTAAELDLDILLAADADSKI